MMSLPPAPARRLTRGAAAIALALLAAASPVCAEAPFSFAATPGQLPKIVVPVHYSLALTPDATRLTFRGRETVDLKVLAPTRRFVLNQIGLQISEERLSTRAGQSISAASVNTDDAAQTLTLTFPHPLASGAYRLALAYRGKIGRQAQGLYALDYQTKRGSKRMLATMMEPTDARRLFPGWDEPSFRATYQISAVVPRRFLAVSNMPVVTTAFLPNGLKRVSFAPTPPMPSYLVVLAAGELEAISGQAGGIKLRVITTEGKCAQGRFALDAMKKLLPYYNAYFGVRYPLPKLDLIAVPGGFNGAMENWGGIVFDEDSLLFDPASSSERTKQDVFVTVSHEMAHQWFGDLVTMAWWDNLWLNEGFASWMEVKASDHFYPNWHLRENAATDKSDVMEQDASRATHPIHQPVRDPVQASAAFDDITYLKGGAVIRMLETYLGEDKFRAGIRRYMALHQYANTTGADLWTALQTSSGKPVGQIAPGWTEQPGLPVVRVALSPSRGIVLTQQPFSDEDGPSPLPRHWQVPVVWQTLGGGTLRRGVLLLGRKPVRLPVAPGQTVEINAGNTGYYRAQYAPALFRSLTPRLETLPPADRVGLIGDTWALAQAGRTPMSDSLDLIHSARSDTDLAVAQQIGDSLDTLTFLERGQPGQSVFEAYLRSILNAQFARIGWDAQPGETVSVGLRRSDLIADLGRLGDRAVVAQARVRFARYLQNPATLTPGLRGPVFGLVGRYADQATYDRLRALARAASGVEEKSRFYRALAGALDPRLAQQTLNITLTEEVEPNQTPSLIRGVAYVGEQPGLAWQFVRQHEATVLAKQPAYARAGFVPELFAAFSDTARADELAAYARSHPAVAPSEAARAVARIRLSARLKQRALPQVDRWIALHGS